MGLNDLAKRKKRGENRERVLGAKWGGNGDKREKNSPEPLSCPFPGSFPMAPKDRRRKPWAEKKKLKILSYCCYSDE